MRKATIILVVGAILSSCGEVAQPVSSTNTIANSQTESGDKSSTDYKAMFGPDYQKGDVGHSTGVIQDQGLVANVVVIEHGQIHGIERGADTTRFETLDELDLSSLSPGNNVEFLVKKGADNIYRVFAICEILEDGKSCL